MTTEAEINQSRLDLRNLLEALLTKELGKYTFENEEKKPAIAIVPPNLSQQITNEDVGVECLIYQAPEVEDVPLMSCSAVNLKWQIMLIQWDTDKTLQNADYLMRRMFDRMIATKTLQRKRRGDEREELDYEQLIIKLEDRDFARLTNRASTLVADFYSQS